MTSAIVTLLFAAAALLFALALAFLPLRLLVFGMAKSVRGRLREWVERRSERRTAPRETGDRRKSPPPYAERSAEKKREDDERRRNERRDAERRAPSDEEPGSVAGPP